mmetsp:Transcript_5457/g.5620  ORF Transcript_5457/g.5620 Transcript_5457/m.5620 type:complete len:261 (+) Transcript_5457:100-882(+)
MSNCPRETSRKVKQILNQEIYSKLNIDAAELPKNCNINPILDIHHYQEQNKSSNARGEWICKYCGKRFVDEFYIDRHMDNKHQDKLQHTPESVCFADLCPILGCSLNTNTNEINRRRGKRRGGDDKSFHEIQPCSANEVERNKFLCETLMRRCFSPLESGAKLESHFKHSICDELHCRDGVLIGASASYDKLYDSLFVWNFIRIMMTVLVVAFIIIYLVAIGSWKKLIGSKVTTKSQLQRFSWWRWITLQKQNYIGKKIS